LITVNSFLNDEKNKFGLFLNYNKFKNIKMKTLRFIQFTFILFAQILLSNNKITTFTPMSGDTYALKVLNDNSLFICSENQDNGFLILLSEKNNFDFSKLEAKSFTVKYQKNYLVLSDNLNSYALDISDYKYESKESDLSSIPNLTRFPVLGITKVYGKEAVESTLKFCVYCGGLYADGIDSGGMTCNSGGPGATQCAVSGGAGSINSGCEVTCANGYYACCNQFRSICGCVKITK
jgi:hypothetical protein